MVLENMYILLFLLLGACIGVSIMVLIITFLRNQLPKEAEDFIKSKLNARDYNIYKKLVEEN